MVEFSQLTPPLNTTFPVYVDLAALDSGLMSAIRSQGIQVGILLDLIQTQLKTTQKGVGMFRRRTQVALLGG